MWLQVDLRLLLWSSDQQWGILLKKWLSTPFRQLTLATMESSVAAFQKMLPRMEQRLPANEVNNLHRMGPELPECCSILHGKDAACK